MATKHLLLSYRGADLPPALRATLLGLAARLADVTANELRLALPRA